MCGCVLAMAIGLSLSVGANSPNATGVASVASLLTHADDPAARAALATACAELAATDSGREALGYAFLAVATDRSAAQPSRRLALEWLGKACDEWVTPQIADLLHDPAVALDAVEALRHIPHTDPTAALAVALEWAEGDLLIALLNALGSRRDVRSSSDVVSLLETTPDTRARRAALDALGMIEDRESLGIVLEWADDSATHNAATAAGLKIARVLEPDEAVGAFAAVLGKTRSVSGIAAAITALGATHVPDAVDIIAPYSDHPSPRIRTAAERALKRIAAAPID